MDKKTITLFITIFVFLIAGMFGYAFIKKTEINNSTEPEEVTEEEVLYPGIVRIDAKHFFVDGDHTIVGELVLPTPCDLLEVDSVVRESYPEQVVLSFNVINNSTDCLMKETTQRFRVDVTASKDAQISALFMGREVELNLIPAAPSESPDEFELFIKG